MKTKVLEGFVARRNDVVLYVCPFRDALSVVDAVLRKSTFRSLHLRFAGYDDADSPLVEIEVVFKSDVHVHKIPSRRSSVRGEGLNGAQAGASAVSFT